MKILLLTASMIAAGLQPATAAAPGLREIEPTAACNYLRESGLGARGWTNSYEDVYGCSSPYKELGTQYPMANNLAYYVDGKADRVSRLKLVLNVNFDPQAENARAELLKAAILLTAKSLNRELPIPIRVAIRVGRDASAEAAGVSFEVLHLDWPTGKGYEVQFIIK